MDIIVGELRDIVEEWMQWYYDHLSKGTIAEGSKLNVKTSPVKFRCFDCQEAFTADIRNQELNCPSCQSESIELVSGREFFIESIGVV